MTDAPAQAPAAAPPHRRARRAALLVTVLLGSLALLGVGLTPAAAATPRYVALGDSYSSGVGTRSYLDDGTQCARSMQSYAGLLATARGWQFDLRACSGARIPDVASAQLSALSSTTDQVTISVGGNDVGFSSVLTTCALPSWASNCDRAIDTAMATLTSSLPAALDGLYGQIRQRAPRATVMVVGYPRLFNGQDCNILTFFSPHEESRLNQSSDRLNAVLQQAATKAGFGFVNPVSRFTGHAVCDKPEWINGLSLPQSESFHPNRAGHASGYLPLVSTATGRAPVVLTGALRDRAQRGAQAQADLQRQRAGADARIAPKTFLVPDLGSADVKAAARRAGVNLADRQSVAAADRTFAARQAASFQARHR